MARHCADADRTPLNHLALIVGLQAEAKIARRSGWPVFVGGGSASGAERAAQAAVAAGASALVSFGLAGGLMPGLTPGSVIVANRILAPGSAAIDRSRPSSVMASAGVPCMAFSFEVNKFACGGPAPSMTEESAAEGTDTVMRSRIASFGDERRGPILGDDRVVALAADKSRLWHLTGAIAVDLESGAVATVALAHGLPCAALRVICDPAERDLPPAALTALDGGGAIGLGRVLASVARTPAQILGLCRLARDAAVARRALVDVAKRLGSPAILQPEPPPGSRRTP